MSWFRRPVNIAITIGAAILLVACIAMIIYGVATHSEPGLLEVCWRDTGQETQEARYLDTRDLEVYGEAINGTCDRVEKLVWSKSQIPITVAATTHNGSTLIEQGDSRRECLDAAIYNINSQVGFELFVAAESGAADVLVKIGAAVEVGRLSRTGKSIKRSKGIQAMFGKVKHHKFRDRLYCDVVIYSNIGDIHSEFLVTRHELLHCAGLSHDNDNPNSAIYPFTVDITMWHRMNTARITDYDRELLGSLYNPENH